MNIIIMLILISLLVLVHELGHYLAARAFGIQVSHFGLGLPIGPVLYETKCGDTKITVHAFLLGGYVSFPDDDEENEDTKDLPLDSPKRFRNKKPWQKAVVVSAGVFANVVFALILVMFCAAFYHKLPSSRYDVFVKDFAPEVHSNIKESGIKQNDKIISVNGFDIDNSYQFIFLVQKSRFFDGYAEKNTADKKLKELKMLNPGISGAIKTGEKIKLPEMTPEKELRVQRNVLMGIEKYTPEGVELTHEQKELSHKLYLKKEFVADRDYALNDIAYALSDSYKPLSIKVLRNDKEIEFHNLKTSKDGLLGVKLEVSEIFVPVNTPFEVLTRSWDYLVDNTKLMLLGLWQLVSGKIPLSDMHGIVAITKVGGDIIENSGMLKGLLLSAIISIDLAIINLLPIPALDGGHLLFLALEKAAGRELDEKIVEGVSRVFFMLLILLMIYVVFNDIFALVTKQL